MAPVALVLSAPFCEETAIRHGAVHSTVKGTSCDQAVVSIWPALTVPEGAPPVAKPQVPPIEALTSIAMIALSGPG